MEWAPRFAAKFKGFMERQQTGLTPAALMESSGGQPDVERLPAAFGEQTVLAKTGPARSETAQYNTPG